jgi:hypothetical protein
MTQSLVDPDALVADAVDAASPAAAAGSAPDPSASIAAPPLPAAVAGPTMPAPAPPPMLAAPEGDGAPMAPPAIPTGAQPSAPMHPSRGAQILHELTAVLPQLTTMFAASRMSPLGGAGLMEGFVRGHQAALAQRMQEQAFQQKKSEMAASFVEHAMGSLTTIASTLGPAAYAQAIAAYKHLAPSFGIDPATFDRIGTSNSDVVSEKQREKLAQIYDRALKGLPDDMPPEERAKAVVQVPGFGPMPLGHLATLAGVAADATTGQPIVPGAPDANKSDRDRDIEALYTIQEQKLGRKLTRGEKAQVRADYVAKGRPSQSPEEQALRAFATGLGKTVDQLTIDEHNTFLQKRAAASKDPTMASLAQQTAEVNLALKKIQEGQQPTREDASAVAHQIISHQLAPSQLTLFGGGMGTAGAAFKRMVGAEAIKLDPTFNWEEAESTYQLAKSPAFQGTVRYMDSVRESMPRLQQAANALANSSVRFVNGIKNLTKEQLNDPTLKAFKTDVLLVGDEVAKILQGGGTGSATSDAKLNQAASILSTADSPKSIAAALNEIQALIGFRRTALTRGTYLEEKGAPTAGGGVATLKFNPKTGKTEPVSPLVKK